MSHLPSTLRGIHPPGRADHPAFDVQSYFRPTLVALGGLDAALRGIFMPEPELGEAKVGVTAQFLEDAETYHRKYTQIGYFRSLLERAFGITGPIRDDAIVLDVGSGSGNPVFPCLDLLPGCHVIATDISESLLAILLRHASANTRFAGRMVPVCMDATRREYFEPGRFDLVLGAAILHHLIDPSSAISSASTALAPGGSAIFFEPFENGSAILRLAFLEILRREEDDAALAREVRDLLLAIVRDIEVRAGTDKSDPIYRRIDDKWLFTKSYLEAHAREAGFREVIVHPIHDLRCPFSNQTRTLLRLGADLPPESLPEWGWAILTGYDEAFSPELKRDLPLEGCIVMKR